MKKEIFQKMLSMPQSYRFAIGQLFLALAQVTYKDSIETFTEDTDNYSCYLYLSSGVKVFANQHRYRFVDSAGIHWLNYDNAFENCKKLKV